MLWGAVHVPSKVPAPFLPGVLSYLWLIPESSSLYSWCWEQSTVGIPGDEVEWIRPLIAGKPSASLGPAGTVRGAFELLPFLLWRAVRALAGQFPCCAEGAEQMHWRDSFVAE